MTRTGSSALAAVALVAAVWALLHVGWYTHGRIVDTGIYQAYGDAIVHDHAVPYRDFALEYPPGALPAIVVPAWLEHLDYRRVFWLEMALCHLVAVLAAGRVAGRRAAVLVALAPLALGSVVLSRFDLWPAALTVVALAALLRGRATLSAVVLATGFAAKLWPAVLAPLFLVWLVRTSGPRAAARWAAAAVATAAAWFLPFAALSPSGVGHLFHVELARPLQLESLGASILIAVHALAGTSLRVVTSYGSQNVAGPGAHAAAIASSVAAALALLAVWWAFARRPATAERLATHAAAAGAALVAFGKVFSPQYLIWLIPLVPLARGRRAPRAVPLFAAALVLTQLWFPSHYWELATSFTPWSWLVLARDLSVVALAAVLAWPALPD